MKKKICEKIYFSKQPHQGLLLVGELGNKSIAKMSESRQIYLFTPSFSDFEFSCILLRHYPASFSDFALPSILLSNFCQILELMPDQPWKVYGFFPKDIALSSILNTLSYNNQQFRKNYNCLWLPSTGEWVTFFLTISQKGTSYRHRHIHLIELPSWFYTHVSRVTIVVTPYWRVGSLLATAPP